MKNWVNWFNVDKTIIISSERTTAKSLQCKRKILTNHKYCELLKWPRFDGDDDGLYDNTNTKLNLPPPLLIGPEKLQDFIIWSLINRNYLHSRSLNNEICLKIPPQIILGPYGYLIRSGNRGRWVIKGIKFTIQPRLVCIQTSEKPKALIPFNIRLALD